MEHAKIASGFFLAAALFAALPSPGSAAFRYFDPERPFAAPKLISATGFYDNTAAKQVTAAAVPFTVNTPLWSDGAGKRRWVILKPGARIRFADVAD